MKILITNEISNNGINLLKKANFEIITSFEINQKDLENFINNENIDAIIIDNNLNIYQEQIDACPSLKLICTTSNSIKNIDVQYAIDQGLYIVKSSIANSQSIAELVFAHLFGMVRFLPQLNRDMPLEGDRNFLELQKMFLGSELRGKTLGIIGMNESAIETAKIALGIGMKIIFSNNEPKSLVIPVEFFDGQGVEFNFEAQPFSEVIKKSDFISLHIYESDNYIIDEIQIDKMKDGVGIINCTGNSVLNEFSLVKAIEKQKIKYAALDVFEKQPNPEIQLLMNHKLSLSPNIGNNTHEAIERMGIELANKIIDSLQY